jgi:hypothetical protein
MQKQPPNTQNAQQVFQIEYMLQTSIIGGLLGLCFESFLRAFIHHLETSGVRPSPEVGSMYGKKSTE